jgi:hypothetical protein
VLKSCSPAGVGITLRVVAREWTQLQALFQLVESRKGAVA